MTGEFKTSADAARMLADLEKAMAFCIASGPKSTAGHAKRMNEVRAERDRLAAEERQALDSPWRVGRQVPRNLYRGDDPIAMLATSEMAATIAAAMNLAERMGSEKPENLSPWVASALRVFNDAFGRVGRPVGFQPEEPSLEARAEAVLAKIMKFELLRGFPEVLSGLNAALREKVEAMIRERVGEPCNQCGQTRHADGSPVTWLCASCRLLVCRDCALRVIGREPPEYYDQTLCSSKCWEAAGRPDD